MSKSLKNMEDKELMLSYQKGDHLAFEALYFRYKDKVYSYLNKRLHKKSDIDDLYQKVMVKFHKSRMLYSPKYEVLAWFYTISRSELLDYCKKKNISMEQFDEGFHSSKTVEHESDYDIDAEKSLSQKEKEAIKMRYLSEADFKEISEFLRTSESNARKLISRGLNKLRKKYQGAKS